MMRGIRLAPLLPAEHAGPVHEDDLPHLRPGACAEILAHASFEPSPWVLAPQRRPANALGQRPFDSVERRSEQATLVAEVVIQGAGGHSRLADDLIGGPRVASARAGPGPRVPVPPRRVPLGARPA